MPAPESIDAILARLMPVAISEEGQRSLDAMLDELCGPETDVPASSPKSYWKYLIPPAGIAAAVTLALIWPGGEKVSHAPAVAQTDGTDALSWVGESESIEALSDEGWVADPQGGVMQAMRVRVVGENTLRDEETGIVMQISEPREEMLFYQVNAF